MPAPGEMRPAHLSVAMHDLVWEFLYLPVIRAVDFLAQRLNYLQFLTIRQYLSVVFGALVSLLLVLASWPLIGALSVEISQMLLSCFWRLC